MATTAADEICRDDGCEREDVHPVHPFARFRLERCRQRILDDGIEEDIPSFYRTRILASAPFRLQLYNGEGLDFGVYDHTARREHVIEGFAIAIPAQRHAHRYEIAVANRTRARPMCCLAAFPGERGTFKHQLEVEHDAPDTSNSHKPPWQQPAKEALRESIVRAVSSSEAKTFSMLKRDVLNDYGKISEHDDSADRTLHRALEAVLDAGQIIRVEIGERLCAYLQPGSRLRNDPEFLREQIRLATHVQVW